MFSARVFIALSSEITFGDKFGRVYHFPIFFMNLADRDFTEYQITQTLTLS